LKAIEGIKAEGLELISNPDIEGQMPEDRRDEWRARVSNIFEIPLAKAQSLNGDGTAALATMEAFGKAQPQNDAYFDALGDIYVNLKRNKDALDAYTKAAVNDERAADKARKLYVRLNGSGAVAKFDADLERRQAELPFHPPAFVAPADWKGKTVLAELFTGSECPPCVSVDLAFDGLLESYPAKYLAILEYHLPIPGPDPMMNPATKKREEYYAVNSTPTVFFDGGSKMTGGGSRAAALASFNRLKKEIDEAMPGEPGVAIKATARLEGDKVTVDCEFSNVIENAEYNVVLVQSAEKHKGGNGIATHKMVVRDIETLKPSERATAAFNLADSEKAADAHLTEYEKTVQARRPDFKWPARRNIIDRSGLKVVVFVQDAETKQVHNAFVADVAKR
jgi:thiol-disulfide isomerase/thioredoxin